jgi:RNA recognition motif-containing protein
MVNIYVGNLSYEATQDDLRQAFEAHGEVSSVSIIMDKMTGRSRGFGFVEMPDQGAGQAAISALNLQEIRGRAMTVNEARPKTEGGGSRGGGGGGRGGFGGGGRGGFGGGRGRSW